MSTLDYFNKKSTRDSSVDSQCSDFPFLQGVLPGSTTQAVCDETSKDRSINSSYVANVSRFCIAFINFALFFVFSLDCLY